MILPPWKSASPAARAARATTVKPAAPPATREYVIAMVGSNGNLTGLTSASLLTEAEADYELGQWNRKLPGFYIRCKVEPARQ